MNNARDQTSSSSPLLSIVIPCFNAMPYIEEALAPVVDWPSNEVEIIVQDGGSTDGTAEVVKRYGDRVRFYSEHDRGQTDALNRAIRRSNGRYIGWLNADDLYVTSMWSALRDALIHDSSADIIYGNYSIVYDDGTLMREVQLSQLDWGDFYPNSAPVWSGGIIWRRDVFERFGYFDDQLHYCMDTEYYFRVGGRVRACHVPAEFGRFRLHKASKTGSDRWKFVREGHQVRKKYADPGLRGTLTVLKADLRSAFFYATKGIRESRLYSRFRHTHRY